MPCPHPFVCPTTPGPRGRSRTGSLVRLAPVNLVAAIREVDDPPDLERLIQQVHLNLGLETGAVRQLIDESFRDAEEIAQQFA